MPSWKGWEYIVYPHLHLAIKSLILTLRTLTGHANRPLWQPLNIIAGNVSLYSVQSHHRQSSDSDWLDFHLHSSPSLPMSTRRWLLDKGSLTTRLIKSSQGDFKVVVLKHEWQRPRQSEVNLLTMRPRENAIIREVLLMCNGEPWVFARSIIPASAIKGRLRRLRKFSDSSLGAMLFSDTSMRRKPFQIIRINGQSKQLPIQCQSEATTFWGRRCRFELAGKAIMVSEIFLPKFTP